MPIKYTDKLSYNKILFILMKPQHINSCWKRQMSGKPSRSSSLNSLATLPGCSFTRMGQKHFWKAGTDDIALHNGRYTSQVCFSAIKVQFYPFMLPWNLCLIGMLYVLLHCNLALQFIGYLTEAAMPFQLNQYYSFPVL